MGLLKRKKSDEDTTALLQSESHPIRSSTEPQEPQSSSSHNPAPGTAMAQEVSVTHDHDNDNKKDAPPNDLLDPGLIGRTIKLVRADNWEQDILPTPSTQTQIIYENQRGMFWFGKPYFSGNSLVRTGALDPPRFQRTSTRLTINPGSVDPSSPSSSSAKNVWPPDPSRLYYSTYGPHSGILELDSLTGNSWKWKQDRWYVDMRGDVDEEGWEYAYIWDGRYYFIGGNWHGKSVLGHSWVRRRRWVRELVRKKRDKKAVKDGKKEEQVGKPGGGGFDGLLIHLRATPSPNLRRKLLKEFFDACLPKTLKQLSSYIQRIYMLIDPLSTMDLIRILESQLQTFESEEAPDTELTTAIKKSLEYLNSKHESLAIRTGRLPPLKHLPEKDWSSHSPSPTIETLIPSSRRSRLRKLRTQWRQSAEPSIAKLVKKVRFQTTTATISEANSPETPGTRYVDAPEEPPSLGDVGRAISSDSGREEWFVAPESAGEKVEPAKSVSGLLRMKGELSGQVKERETGNEEDGTK